MDKVELVERMRKASKAIYIAADKVVADDISQMLIAAADHIDALEGQVEELKTKVPLMMDVDFCTNHNGFGHSSDCVICKNGGA